MSTLSVSQQKEIEHLATNTPNLKDWGKDGFNKKGELIQGHYQLKDNRVIKLSDLYSTSLKKAASIKMDFDVASEAEKHADGLKDIKSIGIDKNGNLKKGFYQLKNGKVIGLNALKKAVAKATKNIKVEQPETV